ncbi:MAG: hypothetical protein ACW98F_18220 [Candidatus Hodarchaeales archaeon]|jgi:hypothetical protein
MSDRVELTEEEEKTLLRWVIFQIVQYMKKLEEPGDHALQFFNKIKLQKMLFLITEDCQFDITRLWYRYGGYVMTPFDSWTQARKFYYQKDHILPDENKTIHSKFKTKLSQIHECVEMIYNQIRFRRTEDFLDEFYTEKAPAPYQEVYQSMRKLRKNYRLLISTQQTLDQSMRSLLPTYDRWRSTFNFQKDITQFHLDLSPIVPEDVLSEIINYTHLLEQVTLKHQWKIENNKISSEEQLKQLHTLDEIFDRKIWGLVAWFIGIDTVVGVRANVIKQKFQKNIEAGLPGLKELIHTQKSLLVKKNLLPSLKLMKTFFDVKYREMYDETVEEGKNWLTQQ